MTCVTNGLQPCLMKGQALLAPDLHSMLSSACKSCLQHVSRQALSTSHAGSGSSGSSRRRFHALADISMQSDEVIRHGAALTTCTATWFSG